MRHTHRHACTRAPSSNLHTDTHTHTRARICARKLHTPTFTPTLAHACNHALHASLFLLLLRRSSNSTLPFHPPCNPQPTILLLITMKNPACLGPFKNSCPYEEGRVHFRETYLGLTDNFDLLFVVCFPPTHTLTHAQTPGFTSMEPLTHP